MIRRWSIILGIMAIPIGIFFMIAASVPELGSIFVKPFCNGEFQAQALTCITADTTTRYEDVLGGIGVVFLVGGSILLPFGFVFGLIATSVKLNHILADGEAAEATILEMQTTGTTVNDQPLFKFRLRVQPAYGQIYEAETQRIIPQSLLGSLAIGVTIPVKYDPEKPEDVALDLEAFQATALEKAKREQDDDESLSEKLQELEKAYRLELITKEEYETSRQRILDEL